MCLKQKIIIFTHSSVSLLELDGKLSLKIALLVAVKWHLGLESSEGLTELEVQDGFFAHKVHDLVGVTSMLEPGWAFLSLHAASLCGYLGLPQSVGVSK